MKITILILLATVGLGACDQSQIDYGTPTDSVGNTWIKTRDNKFVLKDEAGNVVAEFDIKKNPTPTPTPWEWDSKPNQ